MNVLFYPAKYETKFLKEVNAAFHPTITQFFYHFWLFTKLWIQNNFTVQYNNIHNYSFWLRVQILLALWLGYYFVQSSHLYLDGWLHLKK